MPHQTLATRLAQADPWDAVAHSRIQIGRILAAAWTTALASIQRSGVPRADAAWMLARLAVALFLLAAAGRLGHGGLFSRIIGQ